MSHRLIVFCGALAALDALGGGAEDCRIYRLSPDVRFPVLPVFGLDGEPNLPETHWYGPIGQGGARSLTEVDLRVAAAASQHGPLAYVETNYYGSTGYQSAALWRNGTLVMPLTTELADSAAPPEGPPINRALRALGVVRTAEHDEFLVMGLGLYRSNDEIVARATEWRR